MFDALSIYLANGTFTKAKQWQKWENIFHKLLYHRIFPMRAVTSTVYIIHCIEVGYKNGSWGGA